MIRILSSTASMSVTPSLHSVHPSTSLPGPDPTLPSYLRQSQSNISRLPLGIKEATESDAFEAFTDPASCYDPGIPVDELWGQQVNSVMYVFLGKGVDDMRSLVRWGKKGVEAYSAFVEFLMHKGVDPFLFEPRMEILNEAIFAITVEEGRRTWVAVNDVDHCITWNITYIYLEWRHLVGRFTSSTS